MSKKVLLIGPRNSGKTTSANKIAEVMGLAEIFELDGFKVPNGYKLRDDVDALFIASKLPRGIRREHFDIVIEINKGYINVNY